MADFSGDTFGAIDSNAVDPDKPLDAWAEHALGANIKAVWRKRRARATWAPIGGREIQSVQWTALLRVPWPLQPSADSLDAAFSVLQPESTPETNFEFRVRVTDGQTLYFDQDVLWTASGTTVETVHVSGDFDETPAQRTPVVIFFESRLEPPAIGVDLGAEAGDFVALSRYYTAGNSVLDSGVGTVVGVDTDITGDRVKPGIRSTIQDPEIVPDPDSNDSDDEMQAVVLETRETTGPDTEHDNFGLIVGAMRADPFELYGVDLEIEYDDGDVPIETSSPSGHRGPLAAQQTYDASAGSYLHARTTSQALQRPRPLCIGYSGLDRDEEDNWPSGAPELWAYTRGDTASSDVWLDQQAIGMSERPDSDIEIRALIGAFNLDPARATVEPRGGQTHVEALLESAIPDEWSIQAKIEQYQDGSATPVEIVSETANYQIDHIPADAQGLTPLPTLVYYLFNGHTTALGWPDDLAWIYREGQTWGFEQGDLGVMRTITIRLSGASRVQDRPMLATLDAGFVGGGNMTDSEAVLTLLGLSVWERPS